jgi:hypothetical protein
MRKELELIEKIEQYLNGQLEAAEKTAFEEQMAGDPGLREEIRLQKEIMKGIERAALRKSLQGKRLRFRRGRRFTQWGSAGLVILVVAAAILYYKHNAGGQASGYEGRSLPAYNESGEKSWADADRNLGAQTFEIKASDDTVIETKGGLVLSVPANAFLDEDGKAVKGKLELIVKEALDPASIINAGLSSKSGNRLLESGGMFFVDARKDGKALTIDPSNGIYAEVPVDTLRAGMQLFRGKRLADGNIDWVNPTLLEHYLVPVDIQSLDFYPPHYLDSLARWGYDIRNKVFTDSLYYSFAWMFSEAGRHDIEEKEYREWDSVAKTEAGPYDHVKSDSIVQGQRQPYSLHDTSLGPYWGACAVNPAKIKAIWHATFQNTLLSTREFEERIPWIHKAGLGVLDLYVSNLDKDLCSIDSMAARACLEATDIGDRFYSFAARRDGKVKNGNRQFDKLREYYRHKAEAFTEAISKTQREFWNNEIKLDREAGRREVDHQYDSINRMYRNFREEVDLNLREAYRQLGYGDFVPVRWTGEVYRVQVTNTGWCNVDRYVEESVLDRKSLDLTEPLNGKKAIINYSAVSFRIIGSAAFDRLYVYLLPDKLNSFMRLDGRDGKYSEKLDELLRYKLVCVGYRDEQAFFYSQDDIRPKDYSSIVLKEIGKNELDRELNSRGNKGKGLDMQAENNFFQFEIRDQKRTKRDHSLRELRDRVELVVFPCYQGYQRSIDD